MKVEIDREFLRGSFSPETVDEKSRTAELLFTTGAKVRRVPWFSEPYNEELSLKPNDVRMDRLNAGAPLLDSHNAGSLSSILGVVESARITSQGGFAKVRFSDRAEVEPIFRDVKNGIIRNVSVGYAVHKYDDVTESDDKIKTFRAVDWEPMEISLVPVGADAAAGVRAADLGKTECEIQMKEKNMKVPAKAVVRSEGSDDPEIPNSETPAAVTPPAENIEEAKKDAAAEAVTQERSRVAGIMTLTRKHGMDEAFSAKLVAEGKTLDQARQAVLEALEKKSEAGGNIRSQISVGRDIGKESFREGISLAIMHRVNPSNKLPDVAKRFRGLSLLDMARDSIEMAGGNSRGLSRREIALASLNMDGFSMRAGGMQSASDFPEILADTVNRTLRKQYELAPKTFVPWCRRATAPDFRQMARALLSEMSAFNKVAQGAEYKAVAFTDGAEKYSLGKYGGIVRLTWEAIVNDDLDAFGRIPTAIVQEGAATEADVVYAILNDNAALSDGVALFHATHGNLAGSGTAISDTSLGVGRAAMRKQTGPKGRKLNLTPSFLLVGPDKESEANKFTSVMYVAAKPSDINPAFNTSLTPIVDPRISGNNWFLAGDPNACDTVEYAYLEGEEGIFTETRMGFEVDGLEIKARLVFAAKAIDYRNLYKNGGA